MSSKPKISCYIRTLNEERKIRDCITAAQQVASEIIIIDCGSTDMTREIATSMGAKVFEQPWLGNGFQKRVGEEKCSNDWVLDLDADEVVSEQLAKSILRLFETGEPEQTVYRVKLAVVTPFGERWHDNSESTRTKLYNRKFHSMPEHKRWDQLDLPKGTKTIVLKGALMHHAFAGVTHLVTKLNNVSTKGANDTKLKSRQYINLRVVFGFPIYFLKHFFVREFWRCGLYGFAYAIIIAFGRWLRDVKMLEIYLSKDMKDKEK